MKASFFDALASGLKQQENNQQYMTKGKQVGVDGSLHPGPAGKKKEGKTNSRVCINVDNVQLLGGDKPNPAGHADPARQEFNSTSHF